jgi:hypothetical protein
MVAEVTGTCRWIVIYDKAYFIGVHLLVCYVSVIDVIQPRTTTLRYMWHDSQITRNAYKILIHKIPFGRHAKSHAHIKQCCSYCSCDVQWVCSGRAASGGRDARYLANSLYKFVKTRKQPLAWIFPLKSDRNLELRSASIFQWQVQLHPNSILLRMVRGTRTKPIDFTNVQQTSYRGQSPI